MLDVVRTRDGRGAVLVVGEELFHLLVYLDGGARVEGLGGRGREEWGSCACCRKGKPSLLRAFEGLLTIDRLSRLVGFSAAATGANRAISNPASRV